MHATVSCVVYTLDANMNAGPVPKVGFRGYSPLVWRLKGKGGLHICGITTQILDGGAVKHFANKPGDLDGK